MNRQSDPQSLSLSDEEVVELAIRAVGRLDIDEARRWLSEDFVLELPYRSGEVPRRLEGRDAHAFMGMMPKLFERMDFTNIVVHGQTSSGLVAAEYVSNGLTRTGASYPNTYAAFFEVTDGSITRWREYFNPEVVAAAFGS